MLKKIIKICSIFFLLSFIAGALYQYLGEKIDKSKFPPPGTMIDIGGYKLHMIDQGVRNGPTVVIEPGLGNNCLSSLLVAPEIAKFARVISYDRAGQGWSDASPLPRTAENIVKDLHAMLHNANVPAPYILVGHSFGGIVVRLFASYYPDEVAGVILLDASHETAFDQELLSKKSAWLKLQELYEKLRWCFDHYFGIERYMTELHAAKCRKEPSTNRSYRYSQIFVASRLSNKVMYAKMSESDKSPVSCQQLQAVDNALENKPLIVISAGKMKCSAVSTQKWAALQADLVTKSKFGKQMIAQHSGHDIMTDQPEIVIEAVRDMMKEL